MLSILIIDDTSEKIQQIQTLISDCDICDKPIIAHDLREAIKFMSITEFDLIVLDLNIPTEWGKDSKPENSIELMNLIHNDEEVLCPLAIVGLTRFDLLDQYITITA